MIKSMRFPCVYAHRNGTAQTPISASTWVQVVFTTETYDTDSAFASSTWTPKAGLICISCSVGNAGTMTANSQCGAAIYKNGNPFAIMLIASPANNGFMKISCCDQANGTDAYTLYGYNPAGASRQFNGGIDATYFTGHWFSP